MTTAGDASLHASTMAAEWFKALPIDARQAMEQRMSRRSFSQNQTIYSQGDAGDAMYKIVTGRVRIQSVSAFGKEAVMVVYGPGHCIGTVSLIDNSPRHASAVADCDGMMDVMLAHDFHAVAQQHPDIYRAVAASYTTWIRNQNFLFFSCTSLEERLASRLDYLLDFGAATSEDRGMRLEVTQEMLASSVAVSRQAISKLLHEWQDKGLIDYRYGSVVVLDRAYLRRVAYPQV